MRAILLAMLVLPPLLSGCVHQGPPEQRAEVALASFTQELGPGGSVRELKDTMSGQGMGGDIRVEYGKRDATLVEASVPGDGAVVFSCDPERRIVAIGSSVSETRSWADAPVSDARMVPGVGAGAAALGGRRCTGRWRAT